MEALHPRISVFLAVRTTSEGSPEPPGIRQMREGFLEEVTWNCMEDRWVDMGRPGKGERWYQKKRSVFLNRRLKVPESSQN